MNQLFHYQALSDPRIAKDLGSVLACCVRDAQKHQPQRGLQDIVGLLFATSNKQRERRISVRMREHVHCAFGWYHQSTLAVDLLHCIRHTSLKSQRTEHSSTIYTSFTLSSQQNVASEKFSSRSAAMKLKRCITTFIRRAVNSGKFFS